jgi:hypothetical protein
MIDDDVFDQPREVRAVRLKRKDPPLFSDAFRRLKRVDPDIGPDVIENLSCLEGFPQPLTCSGFL